MQTRLACSVLVLWLSGVTCAVQAAEHGGGRAGHDRWAPVSRSPSAARRGDAYSAALYHHCGRPDAGLVRVAATILRRHLAGKTPARQPQLVEWLRQAGTPYVRPRAWLARADGDAPALAARVERWLGRGVEGGPRRCGVARGTDGHGSRVVAIVAVRALADLAPLPTRCRTSRWLGLSAVLNADATGAHVLLLDPSGRVKRVPTSLQRRRVRSHFSLDRPGRWTVQLVADLANGPRPVAETLVFVGVKPALRRPVRPAAPRAAHGRRGLLELLGRARSEAGLRALVPDAALQAVARAHAVAMVGAGRVAHDVGHGTPDQRLAAANIAVQAVGENVARAPSIARLHRALWASPSHRANILDPQFTQVGIAVLDDGRGQLWAVEIFTR